MQIIEPSDEESNLAVDNSVAVEGVRDNDPLPEQQDIQSELAYEGEQKTSTEKVPIKGLWKLSATDIDFNHVDFADYAGKVRCKQQAHTTKTCSDLAYTE